MEEAKRKGGDTEEYLEVGCRNKSLQVLRGYLQKDSREILGQHELVAGMQTLFSDCGQVSNSF